MVRARGVEKGRMHPRKKKRTALAIVKDRKLSEEHRTKLVAAGAKTRF
jgi:hypothetical protein